MNTDADRKGTTRIQTRIHEKERKWYPINHQIITVTKKNEFFFFF